MSPYDEDILNGFLPDETPMALDRLPYANRVAELIRMPGALERWQRRCRESFLEIRQRNQRLEDRRISQQYPYALDCLMDDGCPQFGPPELRDDQEPYYGGPLPVSPRHRLSLPDCYLVLALVHDRERPDGGRIDPFPPDDEAGLWFHRIQQPRVFALSERDQLPLDDCLARVVADLTSVATTEAAGNPPTEPAGEATALVGGGRQEEPQTDGPEGGRWVWWKNERHDVPTGNVYRMIEFMWDRHSASYDDLIGPVFDDPVEPQTIRSCANKVKNALPTGFPWRLSTDSESRQLTKVPAAEGA